MKPIHCIVKHEPDHGSYGDCIRACVASILEVDAPAVPHFAHDNPHPDIVNQRMTEFLAGHTLAPFWVHFDGAMIIEDLLSMIGEQNPTGIYMLFGRTENGGHHVIICQGDKVIHDPAWYRSPMVLPGVHGHWSIVILGQI